MDSVDEDRYWALWWFSREQEVECDDPDCDLCTQEHDATEG